MVIASEDKMMGALRVTTYDFERRSDVMPMHVHEPSTAHVTIVTNGTFKVIGMGWDRIMYPGDSIDIEPFQPHEFIAMEDKSRFINILRGV